MPMNAMFAAGLFDNPWILAVLLVAGALANWLAKRRAEKQAGPPEGDEASPATGRPPGKFDLEETLRQLMGEAPPAPRPGPVPPPLPRAAQGKLPPVLDWKEEELHPTAGQGIPAVVGLPRPGAVPAVRVSTAASELQSQADFRFKQLNDQGRHPATVVTHGLRSRAGRRTASRWRSPRSARQAFVASIIFSPPKSLEP